ncbi:MAG: hypothetical protein PHU63_01180 [Candidatus ainarchaeum sp.]|nr:hypothetical protein [Candidatus ainarchaeum sp.]
MKIEKIQENKNKLLNRKEIQTVVSFEGATPKREEIKKIICEKTGSNSDLCVLKNVKTAYGSNKIEVLLYAYENKEKMMENEAKHSLKRNKLIAEEAPKEEKK